MHTYFTKLIAIMLIWTRLQAKLTCVQRHMQKVMLPLRLLNTSLILLAIQVLQGAGCDAKTLCPETVKKLSDAVFLQLNSLQNTVYSNGYRAAKYEVAEYCKKTFGS